MDVRNDPVEGAILPRSTLVDRGFFWGMVLCGKGAYLPVVSDGVAAVAKVPVLTFFQTVRWNMRRSALGQLLVFVLLIVAANFILPRIGIPIHISIIGSLLLTIGVWFVMRMMRKSS